MQKLAPALVAEAVGVFALSFIGVLAIHELGDAGTLGLIGIALAHGLILAIMISAFAAVSGGHINPAVTIGLLVGKQIKIGPAIAYIIAQCIGGVLAGLVIMAIFAGTKAHPAPLPEPTNPQAVVNPDNAASPGAQLVANGTPALSDIPEKQPVSPMGAFLAELVATFFLVTAVWGTAVDPRAPKIGGFGIGLTVTADILAIGPLTGAAMNPARAFGPALASALGGAHYDWSTHWIFWAGPITGGILASLLYYHLIYPKTTSPER